MHERYSNLARSVIQIPKVLNAQSDPKKLLIVSREV